MTPTFRKSALFAATAAALVMLPCTVFGEAKVEAGKPKFDNLPSPEFSGGKSKPFKAQDWLEVEVGIKVSVKPEPKTKTCDRLSVKWYVAVDNPEKAGTFLKLTKEIQHVNVPLDQEIYCSVYLSPSSIKRLTGMEKAAKTSVKFVGYEILVDGQVVAHGTSGGQAKWWAAASDKISDCDTVPLLSKAETPFAAMWWDRFAEEKSIAAGAR